MSPKRSNCSRDVGATYTAQQLQEVKLLASFTDHPNIVRYFCSWVEVRFPTRGAPFFSFLLAIFLVEEEISLRRKFPTNRKSNRKFASNRNSNFFRQTNKINRRKIFFIDNKRMDAVRKEGAVAPVTSPPSNLPVACPNCGKVIAVGCSVKRHLQLYCRSEPVRLVRKFQKKVDANTLLAHDIFVFFLIFCNFYVFIYLFSFH